MLNNSGNKCKFYFILASCGNISNIFPLSMMLAFGFQTMPSDYGFRVWTSGSDFIFSSTNQDTLGKLPNF